MKVFWKLTRKTTKFPTGLRSRTQGKSFASSMLCLQFPLCFESNFIINLTSPKAHRRSSLIVCFVPLGKSRRGRQRSQSTLRSRTSTWTKPRGTKTSSDLNFKTSPSFTLSLTPLSTGSYTRHSPTKRTSSSGIHQSSHTWTRCDLRGETSRTKRVCHLLNHQPPSISLWTSLYDRLLDDQARRLRSEQAYQSSASAIPVEQLDIAELKGRLARVEYEHRELKQLVFNLRSDLTDLITQQPTYRSIVNIPNFVVKP